MSTLAFADTPVLDATPARVWHLLLDVDRFSACLPGVHQVTRSTLVADMRLALSPLAANQTQLAYHTSVEVQGRLAILGDMIPRHGHAHAPRVRSAPASSTGGMTGGYDVVVVGGGTAGCVAATRLSEDPRRRVLLLEAGPDPDPLPEIVADAAQQTRLLLESPYVQMYETRRAADGSTFAALAGRIMGGGSSANAMAAPRPWQVDLDGWHPEWRWTSWPTRRCSSSPSWADGWSTSSTHTPAPRARSRRTRSC